MLVLEKDAEVSKNEKLLKDIDVIQRELEMLRKENEENETLMNDKCTDFDEVRKSYEEFEEWLTHHLQKLQENFQKLETKVKDAKQKNELIQREISVLNEENKDLQSLLKLDAKLGCKTKTKQKLCEQVRSRSFDLVSHDEQVEDRGAPTKVSRRNNPESEEGTEPTRPLAVEVITLSDSED
ncbi:unnamed protein product [Orchesella dallaii]|uniref:Uncharacterized protein n=1 Tax=Orchesella dallaii TaxID=48710 RepID=A0ABP1RBJ6_9HEXA